MKYYRIYLLLLSTVCVNPFLHSSDSQKSFLDYSVYTNPFPPIPGCPALSILPSTLDKNTPKQNLSVSVDQHDTPSYFSSPSTSSDTDLFDRLNNISAPPFTNPDEKEVYQQYTPYFSSLNEIKEEASETNPSQKRKVNNPSNQLPSKKYKKRPSKREKSLNTFCKDLPEFSQQELTVSEKGISEKMFDNILDRLKLSSIKEKSLHYKCQFFVKFIYQLFGTPEEFEELKNAIRKNPDIFAIFKQEDNEIDINKLCNFILRRIYNYPYHTIAFLSKLSELLLGSIYLTTQSHSIIQKSFKSISSEDANLSITVFNKITDTFSNKPDLFYPNDRC